MDNQKQMSKSLGLWCALWLSALLPAGSEAKTQTPQVAPAKINKVFSYLRARLGPSGAEANVLLAAVPNSNLLVAYLSGEAWCGGAGCTLLILRPHRSSFETIGHVTVSRPPIIALRTGHHGYPDIGVWVEGGGVTSGYESALAYRNGRYPGNPTTSGHRVPPDVGVVLIDDRGVAGASNPTTGRPTSQ